MKSSINQRKNSAVSITNKLDPVEDRVSRIEDKVDELQHADNYK
jgi:hypothetical protein